MADDELKTLAKAAGLELNDQELEELRPLWAEYSAQLEVLRSFPLGDEEPAHIFRPDL